MATLTVTQPTGEGISLKFAYAPNAGESAVSGTVFLATTSIDNQEFIAKNFVYTANSATVVLTSAELVRVYTQAKVDSGIYTAALTMSATALDSNGQTVTTTAFTGLATSNTLVYQAVPTTPNVLSLSAQDGYIQFSFTSTSVISPTLSGADVICDVIVNSSAGGIQTFSGLISSSFSTSGTTRSIVVATGADSLTNGQSYEAAVRISNANGNSLFSDTQTIVPNNLPNAVTSVIVNTAYSVGGSLHGTNAAVMNATWLDADADTGGSVLVRFGVVDGENNFNVNTNVQQATVSLTGSNHTASATSVGDLDIPHAWFSAGQNGSDVTQLNIVARIEQTTGGVITNSNLTASATVYKVVLPTLSDINIVSVDAAGVQIFNLPSGGTAIDSGTLENGNVEATLVANYNGIDYTLTTAISNNLNLAQTVVFDDLTYALIDAGSNGTLTYTLTLPDANGTQLAGNLATYAVTSTQLLHAFKDPAQATVTLTGGAVTAAPTVEVTDDSFNFGYTASTYTVVVFDNESNSFIPFTSSTYDGSSTVATSNTGTAYVVARYTARVTKNLTGIPSDYASKYTSPTISSTSASLALYFINPTITNVTISGAVMTITGNTGGASFDAAGVTSIGFTATGSTFDLSSVTANMQGGIVPTHADACAYTVNVTHPTNLQLNVNSNGGAFDGFAFINANNANSALSILN
tara:strand:+ start:292 stop:2373 length:2082 start_codon:yes stop_codon:yes gene_type:complete